MRFAVKLADAVRRIRSARDSVRYGSCSRQAKRRAEREFVFSRRVREKTKKQFANGFERAPNRKICGRKSFLLGTVNFAVRRAYVRRPKGKAFGKNTRDLLRVRFFGPLDSDMRIGHGGVAMRFCRSSHYFMKNVCQIPSFCGIIKCTVIGFPSRKHA